MSEKQMTEVRVKVATYDCEDGTFGIRICFLYEDRGPEIFHKDGFPTRETAMAFGKKTVTDFYENIPGAIAKEEPCH